MESSPPEDQVYPVSPTDCSGCVVGSFCAAPYLSRRGGKSNQPQWGETWSSSLSRQQQSMDVEWKSWQPWPGPQHQLQHQQLYPSQVLQQQSRKVRAWAPPSSLLCSPGGMLLGPPQWLCGMRKLKIKMCVRTTAKPWGCSSSSSSSSDLPLSSAAGIENWFRCGLAEVRGIFNSLEEC